jgi:hypothetical protein
MDCKTCDELLAAYKHAVSLYTTAQRGFLGPLVGDFDLAWKELKRLREACRAADDGLLGHWRTEHTDLGEKVGSSKVSCMG